MKKLITIILCVLLLAGCAESYDGPTETRKILAEYEIRQYSPVDDEVWTNRSSFSYDIYGNNVRQLCYDGGELESELRWTFDERGNQISEIAIDHSGWIPLINYRMKDTYDEQGRLLTATMYDMWGRKDGGATYTYDDEANTATWRNDRGDQIIYYYDENGREVRNVSSDGSETTFTYDERGNLTGWTSTMGGVIPESYEAGYDAQDRRLWSVLYDETGTEISRTTYDYNEAKSITKDSDGSRIDYFDEDGDITLVETYDLDGKLTMVEQYFYRDIQVPADGEE